MEAAARSAGQWPGLGHEGARVFLAGRTLAALEEVAEAIRATGGAAETAEVDALDEQAVDRHADAVVAESGGIDISFNLITHPHTPTGFRSPRWGSMTSCTASLQRGGVSPR